MRRAGILSAGRQLGLVLVALLAISCGGADRVAVDELPVPAGLNGGCSPELLAAVEQHDLPLITSLRKRGAVGNCNTTRWMLSDAVRQHRPQHVTELLAAGVGANANGRGNDICSSPLERAIVDREGGSELNPRSAPTDLEMVKLLLDGGADPNANFRRTPEGDVFDYDDGCITRSIGGGASPMKPLTLAAIVGDLELAQVLIQHGATATATDTTGKTALDYASMGLRPENREAMAALLRETMARPQ
jgi:hypothetical protein